MTLTLDRVDVGRSSPSSRRGRLFWILPAAVVVIAVVVMMILRSGGGSSGVVLGPDDPSPVGAGALVAVLERSGVEVVAADSLADARSAADEDTTILLHDPTGILGIPALEEVRALAPRIVAVEPVLDALSVLAPGVASAGFASDSGALDAGCTLPAAQRAGTISGSATGFRIVGDETGDTITGCFPQEDDAFAVVSEGGGLLTTTVLGDARLLDNANVAANGNAALALGLLGEGGRVVWYQPGPDDRVSTAPPTLGELTPDWLTPAILLLVGATVAAAVWRGRRLGPLVVERLPVVARASETVEGRGRMYANAGARVHAIDGLRLGALSRLSVRLGLGARADVDAVASSAASLLGRDPGDIRRILVDEVPRDDARLVALSDDLALLERAVRAALSGDERPSSTGSTPPPAPGRKPRR